MGRTADTRRRRTGLDPALVRLCRTMTPVQRLEASIRLSEALAEFQKAGARYRESLPAPSAGSDLE